jgi:hypothetical protein
VRGRERAHDSICHIIMNELLITTLIC